ncbi:MAG: sigma-54-dependent Fis family transcriptional regulator [Desulfovibrionaceae bacterium]|nr:sigma-54-dependent Fis family transcriptional regulator [Desulfovibrionaceae bacterium]
MNGLSSFDSGWPIFLTTLTRIIQETGPNIPVRQGLEKTLDILVGSLGYRRVHIELFDLPRKNTKISLDRGREAAISHLFGPGPLATSQVMATRRTLVIEDVGDHPDFIGRPPEELETLSFLCVPINAPKPAPAGQVAAAAAADAAQAPEAPAGQPGAADAAVADEPAAKEPHGVLGTLSVDIPKAPPVFLEAHCDFLSVVATLVGSLSMRLRDELTRPRRRLIQTQTDPLPEPPLGGQAPVAVSKSMRLVLRQVAQAAASNTPVLFRGEEGTGKEFLAELLHAQSPRRARPFLRLSCGTDPQEVVEEALFGVQKGEASESTRSRRGVFELAQGGGVFLDDIEELSPASQKAVLRVIHEGTVLRKGGIAPVHVDARIVAATSASLGERMAKGEFLEDLYYGLSVLPIYVPALRDRAGDILPLAEHFLDQYSKKLGKALRRISTPAIDLLNQYHWPGNARELASCMERAAMLCDEGVVRTYHLPPTLQTAESSNTGPSLSFGEAVAKFEQELLIEALKKARGNMFQAARDLRESYRVVNYKVKKYGIDPKRFTMGRRG